MMKFMLLHGQIYQSKILKMLLDRYIGDRLSQTFMFAVQAVGTPKKFRTLDIDLGCNKVADITVFYTILTMTSRFAMHLS
jgi:hypothetical protein